MITLPLFIESIQDNQAEAKRDYVSTDQNPADLLSRDLQSK